LNSLWTTSLVEVRRRWNVVFEERSMEDIRNDYLKGLWISKEELIRLKEWETQEFIKEYELLRSQYVDLLSGFNMNALSNYHLLERKNQGKM
jgi:hypothetical protein